MGNKKVVSIKATLSVVVLCVILFSAVAGVLMNSSANLRSQAEAKDLMIQSLNSTISQLNSNITAMTSTINSLNASVNSLQKQVATENSSNIALKAASASKDAEINNDEAQITNLRTQVLSNPEIATLENQLENANNTITTLQNQVGSDQVTITSLNSQIQNLETTMANWNSPVANGFSIIQITDTQFLSESNPALFNTLTSWIVNNSNALNVDMVVNTGDIVNDPSNLTEWQYANTAMMQLYNNGVPYCWCAGNHDFIGETNPAGNPNGKWLGGEGFPAFNVAALQSEPYWVASIFNGSSTAVQFSYNGYHFMMIDVAYDSNQTVLDWMQGLIKSNPTVNVIVTTHNFLNGLGTYGYPPSIQDQDWSQTFYNILANDPNVFMTLSGHDINDGTANMTRVGNREDIFFNRQQEDNLQGGATARIYTFNMTNPGNPTISVSTYQTYAANTGGIPKYLTDPLDQFNFTSNLSAYSTSPANIPSGTPFVGFNGYETSFGSAVTLGSYNQTFDLLRFSNLILNGVTSNVNVTTVGANIMITSYNTTAINYTVTAGTGTQTFQVSAQPTSVVVNGSTWSNWSYTNGVVTVTGVAATNSVTIRFT